MQIKQQILQQYLPNAQKSVEKILCKAMSSQCIPQGSPFQVYTIQEQSEQPISLQDQNYSICSPEREMLITLVLVLALQRSLEDKPVDLQQLLLRTIWQYPYPNLLSATRHHPTERIVLPQSLLFITLTYALQPTNYQPLIRVQKSFSCLIERFSGYTKYSRKLMDRMMLCLPKPCSRTGLYRQAEKSAKMTSIGNNAYLSGS